MSDPKDNHPHAPWNLPEYPCDVCGLDCSDCICPECRECKSQGDPACTVNGGKGCRRREIHDD